MTTTSRAGSRLRLGHPAARGSAAPHRHGALHRRHHAARHGARGDPAQPARARADSRHRHQPRQGSAPAWSPCSPAPTPTAALQAAFRAPGSLPERRTQGRALSAPSPPTSSATSATPSPWSSPNRDYQAYDALELIDVDYEPLPAVVDPQKAAADGRAAAARRKRPATSRFTGRSPAATSTPPSQSADGRRPRSHRPAAADPDRDGAARRRGAVHAGDRRADAVEHDAEPAHRPLHHVARHRRARGQAARDRAGSRRRLRQQDSADPGRLHHRVLLDEARAAGEVDRDALARTTSRRRTGAITCRTWSWRRRRTAASSGSAARSGPAWAPISRPRRPAFRRSSTG